MTQPRVSHSLASSFRSERRLLTVLEEGEEVVEAFLAAVREEAEGEHVVQPLGHLEGAAEPTVPFLAVLVGGERAPEATRQHCFFFNAECILLADFRENL